MLPEPSLLSVTLSLPRSRPTLADADQGRLLTDLPPFLRLIDEGEAAA